VLLDRLFRGDHERRGAVVHPGGVTRGHRSIVLEDRFELRERLRGRIGPYGLVAIDDERLLLLRIRSENLAAELPGVTRLGCAPVAFGGIGVHLSAETAYFSATFSPVMPMWKSL
jgi:hypothetical protein